MILGLVRHHHRVRVRHHRVRMVVARVWWWRLRRVVGWDVVSRTRCGIVSRLLLLLMLLLLHHLRVLLLLLLMVVVYGRRNWRDSCWRRMHRRDRDGVVSHQARRLRKRHGMWWYRVRCLIKIRLLVERRRRLRQHVLRRRHRGHHGGLVHMLRGGLCRGQARVVLRVRARLVFCQRCFAAEAVAC